MDVVAQLVVLDDFLMDPIHPQQRPQYEGPSGDSPVGSHVDSNFHELVYRIVLWIFRNRVAVVLGALDDLHLPSTSPKDYFDNPKIQICTM